jgi:hypothetical protein
MRRTPVHKGDSLSRPGDIDIIIVPNDNAIGIGALAASRLPTTPAARKMSARF